MPVSMIERLSPIISIDDLAAADDRLANHGGTMTMRKPSLFSIQRRSEPGAPPGTLIPPSEAEASVIDVFSFDRDRCVEQKDVGIDAVAASQAREGVTWVNLTGLGDTDLIVKVADIFGLHKLALEDVMNVHQRPKVEEFEDHLFIVVRMIAAPESTETEQVSIFLGTNFVLSIQETAGDCFDPVRARIRRSTGRLRSSSADYLAYALIDATIDGYFPVLEGLGEELEQLEDAIVANPQPALVRDLHNLKRLFLSLRRAIWPHRELLSMLSREEHVLLERETRLYFRDCYDHTIQLMDIVETYREIASGLMDVHISSVSARLNEIMKVLTIIATLFMPLGFIASLYGMNFDRSVSAWNMPELGWRLGYPFALMLMGGCAAGLIIYFWRSGWLGDRDRP